MNKKAISLLLVLGILSGYQCSASATVSVSGLVCERNGNKLEFSGSTENKNATLMLKVYNSEYSETQSGGFVYLDTVKTDADGEFSVTITMPETLADGSSATGEYIMVYSDGAGRDVSTFMYTTPSEAANVYETLATKTAEQLKDEFDGTFAEEAELAGVDVTAYNKLSSDDKTELLKWFVSKRTDVGTDNINLLNDCIYIKYISICGTDELAAVAATINPAYGDYIYNNLTEKEKEMAAKYLTSEKYSEYEAINDAFGTAMVLVKISGAKAVDITDLLEENAELLGLADSGSYEDYSDMSASDKLKVNEKLVSAIGGSVLSVSDLADKLETAVEAVQNSSKGGSTGGGGGGSSSGSSSNQNDPIVSKYDTPGSVVTITDGQADANKTVSFTDISNVTWAQKAINYFASTDVVEGYDNTTFAPNDSVTREAFVKILLNASGLYEDGYSSTFADVDKNEWYADYVACAQEKGIVNGISDTEFGIGGTLTRQDMAVIVLRTAQMQGKKLASVREYENFTDQSEISDYASEAVKTLYCAGLLNGMGDGTFAPKSPLTRAQAVKVLYDLYIGAEVTVSQTKTNVSGVSKTEFDISAEFLDAVGILNKGAEEYSSAESITLGAMVNMALNLTEDCSNVGDEIDVFTEALALKYGMISEGYNSSELISTDRAIEILVRAMGYGSFVENGAFNEKAVEIGLLKGVSVTGGDIIDAATAMKLLENAAECSPFVVTDMNSASKTVEVLSDTTMLEYKKNIYKKTGIVTGNEITTLYGANGMPEGYIEIDNEKYLCENPMYGDYLGYRVTYYVHIDDDGNTVKYVKSRNENEVTVIESKDFIDVSEDFRTIEYSLNERNKTLRLSQTPRVFYNGRFYSGYTASDFDMDMGTITVVESYTDDMPDMIFITSYETFIVDRVSNDGTKIYNKYEHSGVTEILEIEDANVVIIKNDAEIAVSDLKEWDILSVAATKNGSDPYYRIYVSDVRESALSEIYSEDEKTVTSIGFIYDIAGSYFDSVKAGKTVGYLIKIGEYQTYALDTFGRVVAVLEGEEESTESYAWIINAWAEDGGEDFGIRYYDVNKQDIINGKIASKLSVNNKTLKSAEQILDSALFDADGKGVAQLVKLELDENGAVSSIETAQTASEADPTKFTKKKVSTTWTYENRSFNHELFLTGSAKILCVPDSNDNYDNYYVLDRMTFDTDRVYSIMTNVTGYDFDDFMRSDMVVVNYNSKGSVDLTDSLEILMVDKVTAGVDSEGEIMKQISGSIGNYEAVEFFVSGDDVLTDVQKGDALYVKFDQEGRITHAQTIFSLNDAIKSGNVYENSKITTQSTRNAKAQFISGWITDVELNSEDGENMVMVDGTTMLPIKLNGNSSKIVVYDAKEEEATVEDINEIEKGDLMLVRMRYSTIKAIVVIKNIDTDID